MICGMFDTEFDFHKLNSQTDKHWQLSQIIYFIKVFIFVHVKLPL